jgi:hypothetical protein
MRITSVSDFRRAIRNGPYAWPGGYPCYFIMNDGSTVSFEAVKRNVRSVLEALTDPQYRAWSGWLPIALDINWEDSTLLCDVTGERIPAAYEVDDE